MVWVLGKTREESEEIMRENEFYKDVKLYWRKGERPAALVEQNGKLIGELIGALGGYCFNPINNWSNSWLRRLVLRFEYWWAK